MPAARLRPDDKPNDDSRLAETPAMRIQVREGRNQALPPSKEFLFLFLSRNPPGSGVFQVPISSPQEQPSTTAQSHKRCGCIPAFVYFSYFEVSLAFPQFIPTLHCSFLFSPTTASNNRRQWPPPVNRKARLSKP